VFTASAKSLINRYKTKSGLSANILDKWQPLWRQLCFDHAVEVVILNEVSFEPVESGENLAR